MRADQGDLRSVISHDPNHETGQIRATALLDVEDRVRPSLLHENKVISIEYIPLGLPLAVGCGRRVHTFRDGIGKVQLSGDHVAVADKNLKVNMGRASWIPARID